jgi:hypothetical protein
MTTSDKTGEKLVASIRRTKRGAAPASDSAAAAKPALGQEATGVTAQAETVPPTPEATTGRDTYRSVGRVWPD